MMRLRRRKRFFAGFSSEKAEPFDFERDYPPPQPVLQRMTVWFSLAFIVRLGLLLQPIDALDRLFIHDGLYANLAIARNIAHGSGPSVDGHALTNGFQPVITYLQALFFRFGLGPDEAARAALGLSGFFGACAAAALGNLLFRLAGLRAAWIGALIMALHPSIIRNDLDGMETSLGVCLSLVVLHAFLQDGEEIGWARSILAGLMAGVALLAQIDTAIVVALLIWHAARHWRPGRAVAVVLAAAAVAAPWFVYAWKETGRFLPENLVAERHLAGAILSYTGSPLMAPYAALCALGRLLSDVTYDDYQNAGLGAAILACGLYYAVRQARSGTRRARTVGVFLVAACAQLAFSVFYLRADWSMPRSLALVEVWAIAMAAHYTAGSPRLVHPRTVAGFIALIFAGPALGQELLGFARGGSAADAGDPCPKAFRPMAKEILPRVPQAAVLGAMRSGALAYFAPPTITVINLDGTENPRAEAALTAKALGAYVTQAGLTYVAGRQADMALLHHAWGSAPAPDFVPVAQTGATTTLYRLDWPAAADAGKK
jgi:hypothetical protein